MDGVWKSIFMPQFFEGGTQIVPTAVIQCSIVGVIRIVIYTIYIYRFVYIYIHVYRFTAVNVFTEQNCLS